MIWFVVIGCLCVICHHYKCIGINVSVLLFHVHVFLHFGCVLHALCSFILNNFLFLFEVYCIKGVSTARRERACNCIYDVYTQQNSNEWTGYTKYRSQCHGVIRHEL